MSREADIRDLQRRIWQNAPPGVSTFSECACGRGNGRGSGPCMECCQESLGKLVGDALATEYVAAVRRVRELEAQMIEA